MSAQVNGKLQSSDPDVFVVGDLANYPLPRYGGQRYRQEHVQNARESAAHAVSAILKPEETGDYDYLPVRRPHCQRCLHACAHGVLRRGRCRRRDSVRACSLVHVPRGLKSLKVLGLQLTVHAGTCSTSTRGSWTRPGWCASDLLCGPQTCE